MITEDKYKNQNTIPAVLYARLSNEDRERQDTSIENQLKDGHQFAINNHLKIIHIFNEGFHTGADRERKEFGRMIECAKQSIFKAIIVKDDSRFCRDASYLTDTIKLMKSLDIKVFTFGGEDLTYNITMTTIRGAISEDLIIKNRNDQRRMMEMKHREKRYFGKPCLGFRTNHTIVEGKLVVGDWIVDNEEKKMIKEIFKMAVEGYSTGEISLQFNIHKEKIYTILTNKKYMGIFEYNIEDKDANGNIVKVTTKHFKMRDAPFVSAEDFNKVQQLLRMRCKKIDYTHQISKKVN